jgi:hypothetical protein
VVELLRLIVASAALHGWTCLVAEREIVVERNWRNLMVMGAVTLRAEFGEVAGAKRLPPGRIVVKPAAGRKRDGGRW